ncbi:DUF6318 family protein [Kocuria sp.]|uniref:DUF6318 family protein n=1 Tax=Kocuria sp. TaxID=1871328 RepID=UPI00281202F8|nr:DUF6318 family protein [Kocuria sp.]
MDRSCAISASVGSALLVALLLTGCGDSDDGAPASPSSAASASTPPPASAAVTPSPGATPADYVPASLDGPAQNVPKPVMPELAKQESKEGAQAFLDYWSDAKWYAYQTGDTSYARQIISEHCEVCGEELEEIGHLYESEGWAIGGRESIFLHEDVLVPTADGAYKPVVTSNYEGVKVVDAGKVVLDEAPKNDPQDTFQIYLDFVDSRWVYITAAPLAGS